jgi:hypothetical protein
MRKKAGVTWPCWKFLVDLKDRRPQAPSRVMTAPKKLLEPARRTCSDRVLTFKAAPIPSAHNQDGGVPFVLSAVSP